MSIDYDLWKEVRQILPLFPSMVERKSLPYLCGTTSEGVEVYLVDGDLVKIRHDPDFVEANNSEESSWVHLATGSNAKYQAIVDWHLKPDQWPFDLYHELYEMRLMRDGLSYDKAHERANAGEMALRSQYNLGGIAH